MSDEILRLIGDGDRASGGAIPLPDAFTAVVQELLDNGDTAFETLNERIIDVLAYKEARIMATSWRAWEDFTRDILKRLIAINVVELRRNRYVLTESFTPGKRYEAFPGTSDIGFTVYSREVREKRNDNSKLLLEVNVLLSKLSRFPYADAEAVRLINEAQKILSGQLVVDKRERKNAMERERRRANDPRPPELHRKALRSGITDFARKFWDEADPDTWYTMDDIAFAWNKENPDQPPLVHSNASGPLRRITILMIEEGKLERKSVQPGHGNRRFEYRLTGEHRPLSDMIVRVRDDEMGKEYGW